MRIIDIAWKDLRQLARDWKAGTFLLAMPIAFTLMFGFAFGGFGGEKDPRLPVGLVDDDGGSPASQALRQMLAGSEVVRPVALSDMPPAELEEKVRSGEMAAVVTIPAGYGERLLAGESVPLGLLLEPNSNAGVSIGSEIQAIAARIAGAAAIARLSAQAYAESRGVPADAAYLQQGMEQALAAWADPPLRLIESKSGTREQEGSYNLIGGFSHSSPSMMVQFAMAGLTGAAEILVLERKTRTLQRLLTTAVARMEIILGHFLAMVAMIVAQFVLLILFAHFLLRVEYLRQPLAVLLVTLAMALWTASLGLLIGALARTPEQVILFALLPMFVLSGLGGAWVPLEFTSPTFQAIGHLTPTAWAMDGLENIVVRGLGLEAVLLPAGVLLAYAVVTFGLALWRFRFE